MDTGRTVVIDETAALATRHFGADQQCAGSEHCRGGRVGGNPKSVLSDTLPSLKEDGDASPLVRYVRCVRPASLRRRQDPGGRPRHVPETRPRLAPDTAPAQPLHGPRHGPQHRACPPQARARPLRRRHRRPRLDPAARPLRDQLHAAPLRVDPFHRRSRHPRGHDQPRSGRGASEPHQVRPTPAPRRMHAAVARHPVHVPVPWVWQRALQWRRAAVHLLKP